MTAHVLRTITAILAVATSCTYAQITVDLTEGDKAAKTALLAVDTDNPTNSTFSKPTGGKLEDPAFSGTALVGIDGTFDMHVAVYDEFNTANFTGTTGNHVINGNVSGSSSSGWGATTSSGLDASLFEPGEVFVLTFTTTNLTTGASNLVGLTQATFDDGSGMRISHLAAGHSQSTLIYNGSAGDTATLSQAIRDGDKIAIWSATASVGKLNSLTFDSVFGVNQPPAFTSDPTVETNAKADVAYNATLADDASDPEYDPMTFSKVGGPDWLTVSTNGTLRGTPAETNQGLNLFSVQVDALGGSDTNTLAIMVLVNGVCAYDDFASQYGLVEGQLGDDDKDGLSNLREYAFHGNPTNPADKGQISLSQEGSTLTYAYASNVVDRDLVYRLVHTADLVSEPWHTNTLVSAGAGSAGGEYVMVTNHYSMTNDALFIKLTVENKLGILSDLNTLYHRVYNSYASGCTPFADGSKGTEYLSTQQTNGMWSDIDYSQENANLYHFDRVLEMAIAFNQEEGPDYQNSAMKDGVITGIEYIYENLTNGAWLSKIGRPLRLGPVSILMEPWLDETLKTQIYQDLHRNPYSVGVNRAHHSEILLWASLLTYNVTDFQEGFDNLKPLLEIATGDDSGIKADYSFWHHENQMYTHFYGLMFAETVSFWAVQTADLICAFTDRQIANISSYLLDHMQWLVYRGYLDFPALGRKAPMQNRMYQPERVRHILQVMKQADASRSDEYDAFIRHLDDPDYENIQGNRHFWISDYNSHRRQGYHIGIRIASDRTTCQEGSSGKSENEHGFYLSQGGMVIEVHGDELYDIWPVLDWARIPGTTTRWYASEDVPAPGKQLGTASFAGGVSDGQYGVVGFDQNWDSVAAKKAWFLFDEQIVALGNSIQSSANDPINTTINQTFQKGDLFVEYSNGSGTLTNGIQTLNNPKWVLHNDMGYLFPQDRTVMLSATEQSGYWQREGWQQSVPTNLITENIFTLYFDHGYQPSGASYEYILVPVADQQKMQSLNQDNPIVILQNDADIQAVIHNPSQRVGAVFYKPGSLAISPQITVTTDKGCIILFKQEDGEIRITACSPENLSGTLNISVDIDGKQIQIPIQLPDGEFAGSSITVVCPF